MNIVRTLLVVLLLPLVLTAQAPPTTVPLRTPALKRDRTQRILYPKIIQYEDERTATNDLVEMLQPPHGGHDGELCWRLPELPRRLRSVFWSTS
jgi:hypothetical protein